MARPRFDFTAGIASFGRRPGATPQSRSCDHPECSLEGLFRAPKSRDNLNSYLWLCLDHVRSYNAAWNYYAGMDETQIEAEIRRDTVWQRPTWPLGWNVARNHVNDPLDIFAEEQRDARANGGQNRRPRTEEERALALFDLSRPFTLKELKRRYKQLVKQHHPDTHGGDKAAEEQLKTIIQAYNLLKNRITA